MKRTNLVFVVMVLLVSTPCYGQEWAKAYDNMGYLEKVLQTSDGSYVVVGRQGGFYWYDVVMKLGPDGAVLWKRSYGKAKYGHARAVEETSDGCLVLAGRIGSSDKVWILKLQSDGSILWQKAYGEDGCCDIAYSIKETADGGLIAAGVTRSFGASAYDIWVLKLDAGGDIIWQNRYGNENDDYAYSVDQTADGGFIVSGYTYPSSWEGRRGCLVFKLDAMGTIEWQSVYDVNSGSNQLLAYTARQTSDGGFIVAGGGLLSDGRGPLLLKLYSDSTVEWGKTFHLGSVDDPRPFHVVHETADGGYVTASSVAMNWDDGWILKLRADGSTEWEREYIGFYNQRFEWIEPTSDGGYVAAGMGQDFIETLGENEMPGRLSHDKQWVVKVDANGRIPYCTAMRDIASTAEDVTVWQENPALSTSTTTAVPETKNTLPEDRSTEYVDVCPALPQISELKPDYGVYPPVVKVKGSAFGKKRKQLVDGNEGYYGFITFSGDSGTMMPTKYGMLTEYRKRWSWKKVKVKVKMLFIDQDGDYLQDENEPILATDQIRLGPYDVALHHLWFRDMNANGTYDDGDQIQDIVSSNLETFVLADVPCIIQVIPYPSVPASSPGVPQKVILKGVNFGETQGTSILHVENRTWYQGHPKVKLWQDDKIKFKVPNYGPPFPKYKDIWVTVNGKDSNKVQLTITAP